jgi:hypothetical protein
VSDVDISLPEVQSVVEDAPDDYDEIEYMPPRPVGTSVSFYLLSLLLMLLQMVRTVLRSTLTFRITKNWAVNFLRWRIRTRSMTHYLSSILNMRVNCVSPVRRGRSHYGK